MESVGEGFAFLIQLMIWAKLWKVLSRVDVSSRVCTSTKFAFFILPFSLERKRKKRGEPTMVPP